MLTSRVPDRSAARLWRASLRPYMTGALTWAWRPAGQRQLQGGVPAAMPSARCLSNQTEKPALVRSSCRLRMMAASPPAQPRNRHEIRSASEGKPAGVSHLQHIVAGDDPVNVGAVGMGDTAGLDLVQ